MSVRLTEIRSSDSGTLFRWINDPETVRFSAPWSPVSEGQHDAWFSAIGADRANVIFAIRPLGDADVLLGAVQLRDIHPAHRSAELLIRIGEARHRGKGYGAQALKLVVDFAWRDMNLQRVWLRVFSSNERAIQSYRRAGFDHEGIMRRAAWIDGAWTDIAIMAILREQP